MLRFPFKFVIHFIRHVSYTPRSLQPLRLDHISSVFGIIHRPKLLLPTTLPSYRTIVLEKLTVSQLVKKFAAFYGNRRFITAFTTVFHCLGPTEISIQARIFLYE
jgi:hypothetical protein